VEDLTPKDDNAAILGRFVYHAACAEAGESAANSFGSPAEMT
jgi:hypothetical protein